MMMKLEAQAAAPLLTFERTWQWPVTIIRLCYNCCACL